MFNLNRKIILGSGSPRRKLLLEELGIDFRVCVSGTDEIPLPYQEREEIAIFLAKEKANALKKNISDGEILVTADTIVWLEGSMLGKPANTIEAIDMLVKLNGRMHQVYTGICMMDRNKSNYFFVESNVVFRKLAEEEIKEYVYLYNPMDKAGAYGAQETLQTGINPCSEKEILFLQKYSIGKLFERTLSSENKRRIPFIDHIEGSYFNVMGLPVVELMEALIKFPSE